MEEAGLDEATRGGNKRRMSGTLPHVSAMFKSSRVSPMWDTGEDLEDIEDLTDFHENDLIKEEDVIKMEGGNKRGSDDGVFLNKKKMMSLLMPALLLYPAVNESETLSEKYDDLYHYQLELWRAAAHVDDAIKGRGVYGKRRAMGVSQFSRQCFTILDNQWWRRLVLLIIIVHSVLGFFEPTQDQVQPGQMHLSVFILQVICLSIYSIDVFLYLTFFGFKNIWKSKETRRTRVELIFTVMFIIDFIILMVQEVVGTRLVLPFRCLRPAMLYAKSRNFAHIFDVCSSIVLSLGKVVLLVFLYCLVFGAAGVHLYMGIYHYIGCENRTGDATEDAKVCQYDDREVYTGTFDNVGIAALRMFVLVSSENYPAVMIPAYELDNANFIFFGFYIYIGTFIVMSVLVAQVVEKYWYYSKKHVKEERLNNRSQLAKAWIILDPDGEGHISTEDLRIRQVLLYIRPKLTDDEIDELLDYIDEDGDGDIDAFEWTTRLLDAINFDSIKEPEEWKVLSPLWLSRLSKSCRRIVTSRPFNVTVLNLIITHSILICIKWYGMSSTTIIITQGLRTTICILFIVEIFIKITALGLELRQTLEVLDLLCSVIGIIANFLWYLVPGVVSVSNPGAYHAILVVVSSGAIFCRLGFNSKPTKRMMESFLKIVPVMFDLVMFVIILIYFYAVLGLELFYGFEPDYTFDSDHWGYGCDLGFATLGCSMLEVFQICTTSNWHEIMNAVMLATTDWSAIYFVTCFCIVDMVVMNLFVAITIEAFKYIATDENSHQDQLNTNTPENKNFSKKALTVLESVFATSRTVQSSVRRKSLAAVNGYRHLNMYSSTNPTERNGQHILGSGGAETARRNSRTSYITKISNASKSSGRRSVVIKRRQEKAIKERLSSRKQKSGNKVKVISAFRKSREGELDLHVGDEVEVLEKCGDYWKGSVRGKVGMFPATHIVEFAKRKPIGPTMGEFCDHTTPGSEDGQVDGSQRVEGIQASNKVKMRGAHGEWRQQILGDLTVMNPSEDKKNIELRWILKNLFQGQRAMITTSEKMLELNRIIQGDRRTRPKSKVSSKGSTKAGHGVVTFEAEVERTKHPEADNHHSVKVNESTPTIQIHFDEPDGSQGNSAGTEMETQKDYCPNLLSAEKATKEKKKKPATTGGVPEWAKQFMEKHNQGLAT